MDSNSIVINNVVKMEWKKSGWLQTKKGRSDGAFIFASQDYPSTTCGNVTVYFTSTTAFVIDSNPNAEKPDVWSASEFIPAIKSSGVGGSFPYDLDEYVAIIPSGESDCIISRLEKYGIVDYKEDIEARKKDIEPYGYEEDVRVG